MNKRILSILTYTFCAFNLFGQVAAYSFNNGNADDEIGSNDGVVSGALLTEDRFGNSDHAYFFDGVDDHINFGDDAAFQMGTGSFSISLWIFTDSIVPTGDILGKKNNLSADNYNQYSLSFNNSLGLIQGAIRGNVNTTLNHSLGTDEYDTTGWNHIVMVYDTMCNCSKLYVNNVLESADTLDLSPSTFDINSYPLVIGWRNFQQDFAFKGKIDDIYIYKEALNAQVVDSLYTLPNPNTASLEDFEKEFAMTVYPNPTNGLLYVKTEIDFESIQILSLQGQLIIQSNNAFIDMSNLETGSYFARILDKKGLPLRVLKIMKD